MPSCLCVSPHAAPCRREVVLLKDLWDLIKVVESSIAAWRTTPWMDIQVDDMEMECKRYAKEIRCLDKEVRVHASLCVDRGCERRKPEVTGVEVT